MEAASGAPQTSARTGRGRLARELSGELVALRPAPGASTTALRAGLAVLVPLLVLAWRGQLDWAIYATFGAFVAVYDPGRGRVAQRVRPQILVGSILVAAVVSGALVGCTEARSWISIPIAAVWAALAAAASDRYRWRPPGPLFVVFGFTACAAIPSGPTDVAAAAAVSAGTALLAVALTVVAALLSRTRAGSRNLTAPLSPGPGFGRRRRRVQMVRCAVAVLVAGTVATLSGIPHPYWAMVGAVVPMAAPTLATQLARGLHRVLGTIAGLGLAAVLLSLALPAAGVIATVAALQTATELLVRRNYGLALIFVTPLALLLGQLAEHQTVRELLTARLVETLIGVIVGVVLVVLTRDRSPRSGSAAGGARGST
jgi:uncharacterized membrane protein YccC